MDMSLERQISVTQFISLSITCHDPFFLQTMYKRMFTFSHILSTNMVFNPTSGMSPYKVDLKNKTILKSQWNFLYYRVRK